MGAYKAAVVTEGGQNLIAQVLATNKALAFTSAKTSNYAYPSGTNITALTGLQDVVQSTQPFKAQAINNNVAQVSVRFDNDGITQQYQIQTIGLYAKIEDGEEILFSVIQAITPDEMPVQSSVSPSAFIYNIQSTVQNASQITITVNPAGTATVQDILDLENPVFDDSGAVAGITSFPNFLSTLVSKMNIFQFYRNLKAGLQFVLHTGQIVNNCMSESPDLPLAAAQGKVLMDLYTQLNSNMSQTGKISNFATSEAAMNAIYDWIINSQHGSLVTKVVGCNYGASDNDESLSGKLYGGTYLLIGYRQGGYASIIAYSYWPRNPILVGIIESSSWSKRFEVLGNFIFQHANGNIKYGMNGIYIGKFNNGPLRDENNIFESAIYLVATDATSTAAYAFTIIHYHYGHLFFNRMTMNNEWDFNSWKKIIS